VSGQSFDRTFRGGLDVRRSARTPRARQKISHRSQLGAGRLHRDARGPPYHRRWTLSRCSPRGDYNDFAEEAQSMMGISERSSEIYLNSRGVPAGGGTRTSNIPMGSLGSMPREDTKRLCKIDGRCQKGSPTRRAQGRERGLKRKFFNVKNINCPFT